MKHIQSLLVLAAGLALAACSSAPRKPDYECPLDDVAAAKCASVQDAYSASNSMNAAGTPRVQSVFDARVQGRTPAAAARPVFAGQNSEYPEPPRTGDPVFEQPQVMRVWVAPYVDADGNLRSGEYTYFSTPGKWNYGSMKTSGAGSQATFGPAKPDKLGFTPVLEAPKKPSKPADSAAKTADGQPAVAAQPATSNGVTQPFQRLTN